MSSTRVSAGLYLDLRLRGDAAAACDELVRLRGDEGETVLPTDIAVECLVELKEALEALDEVVPRPASSAQGQGDG